MERSRAIARVAAANHGVITRAELRRLGVNDSTITYWATTGRLEPLQPAVFRVGGSVDTWTQAVAAAVAAGGEAFAAHRCAAAMWSLDNVIGRSIEVLTLRHQRRPRTDVIVHETRELAIADRSVVRGVPVTSVERTLIDCCRHWPVQRVGACLDDAVRRELTTYDLVAERFVGLARRGRPGIRRMRAVLTDREVLGEWIAGDFEGEFLKLLLSSGLPRPTRQYPMDADGNRYYLDFFFDRERVGIECDSRRFHTLQFQADADLARQNAILRAGILLLRYTPSRLRSDPSGIVTEIRSALSSRGCP